MYSNQGNTVQIEAPEFDPDIDRDNPASTDEKHEIVPVQGTLATISETSEPEDDNIIAPGTNTDQQNYQETNWPDTPPCRYQEFLHRQLSCQNKDITDVKSSPLQKILKYLN